jgi:hypothetical protein
MKLIITLIFLNGTKSSLAWPWIHSSRTNINVYAPMTYKIYTSAIPVLTMHSLLLIHPDRQVHMLPTQMAHLPLLSKGPCVSSLCVLHFSVKNTVTGMVHFNHVQEAPIACAFCNRTGRLVLHLSQWTLCCATPLIQLHPTAIIPSNVLPHNWMCKLDLKMRFYYIRINVQYHKCCSMLFGKCCQFLTSHPMGHRLAAPIFYIFQTVMHLLSQHFSVSRVTCLHCWLICGPTILVHVILLFLQQLCTSLN